MSVRVPFERIKCIKNKYIDIVSGYIRAEKSLKIPEPIKLVILLFYYNTIETSILTDNECDKLLQLFEGQNKFKHLPQYSYKLIYKRTRDGAGLADFESKCYDKPNLVCIISADKNVFGGYTSKGFMSNQFQCKDEDAFIFSIRSSATYPAAIFNAKKGKTTIRSD